MTLSCNDSHQCSCISYLSFLIPHISSYITHNALWELAVNLETHHWELVYSLEPPSTEVQWLTFSLMPHPLSFSFHFQTRSLHPQPRPTQVTSLEAIYQILLSSLRRCKKKKKPLNNFFFFFLLFFTYAVVYLYKTCKQSLMCKIAGIPF